MQRHSANDRWAGVEQRTIPPQAQQERMARASSVASSNPLDRMNGGPYITIMNQNERTTISVVL
jgi:hypothetical protein